MTHNFDAIFENGVLRPLTVLALPENQVVHVVVEAATDNCAAIPSSLADDDPLAGLSADLGISDFAENFDDYRVGRRLP